MNVIMDAQLMVQVPCNRGCFIEAKMVYGHPVNTGVQNGLLRKRLDK